MELLLKELAEQVLQEARDKKSSWTPGKSLLEDMISEGQLALLQAKVPTNELVQEAMRAFLKKEEEYHLAKQAMRETMRHA